MNIPQIGVSTFIKHYFLSKRCNYRTLDSLHKIYGTSFSIKLPSGRRVHYNQDPTFLLKILSAPEQLFPKVSLALEASVYLGQGIITSTGKTWKRQRVAIQPIFNRSSLSTLQSEIELELKAYRSELALCIKASPQGYVERSIEAELHSVVLRIALRLFFGEVDEQERQIIPRTISLGMDYLSQGLVNLKWFRFGMRAEIKKGIHTINRVLRQNLDRPVESLTAFQKILKSQYSSSEEHQQELRDNCLSMLFASYETTGTTLTWLFSILAEQGLVYRKLEQMFQGAEPLSLADIERIDSQELLKRSLCETLRLYPPPWTLVRGVTEATEMGGHDLKSGDQVLLPIYAMHRDPGIWAHPDTFDPERFGSYQEVLENAKQGRWLPFAAGVRSCIGRELALAEMQTITANLIREFRFEGAASNNLVPRFHLFLRPPKGNRMRIYLR